MQLRQSSSSLHIWSRVTWTPPMSALASGKNSIELNRSSSFKEVAKLVYNQVGKISRSTCVLFFRHSIEHLFRYLAFEPLWVLHTSSVKHLDASIFFTIHAKLCLSNISLIDSNCVFLLILASDRSSTYKISVQVYRCLIAAIVILIVVSRIPISKH